MEDEDEIDILGDFSFNSCLAQNNQGIPSCSDREDTVHPQWLLDSTANNWYDKEKMENLRKRNLHARKLSGTKPKEKQISVETNWSAAERALLDKEMNKYGRNVRKISQSFKTKTEAEIQALIEAEYGINLEPPSLGIETFEDMPVVQEEIVCDETIENNTQNMISTGTPTVITTRKTPFQRKLSKNSLLRPDAITSNKTDLLNINPSDILYEDDLIIASTELVDFEGDVDNVNIKSSINHKNKVKKRGNHRRKVSRNADANKPRNKSIDNSLKSPQGRPRKNSSLSEDSLKSPKLQIVLGSGLAVPVSEGEEIIKLEKKDNSELESDVEVDIDSDSTESPVKNDKVEKPTSCSKDETILPSNMRKFEPMPKRVKKFNLDGGGGYTIMHTPAGDLYEIKGEPKKERQTKKQPTELLSCRVYNAEKPAPCEVELHVSTLIAMDAHAHTSRAEVMGLVGGSNDQEWEEGDTKVSKVFLTAYQPAAAASNATHCDMDPVSQWAAARALGLQGCAPRGWHHSHPQFAAAPSRLDLLEQRALQDALERPRAFLGLITSQCWPEGRTASTFRCIHVEKCPEDGSPQGYQLKVRLKPDLTADSLPAFMLELKKLLTDRSRKDDHRVDMEKDICPMAKVTYLEKCISSVAHHLSSAGYEENDEVRIQLLQALRDIFR